MAQANHVSFKMLPAGYEWKSRALPDGGAIHTGISLHPAVQALKGTGAHLHPMIIIDQPRVDSRPTEVA